VIAAMPRPRPPYLSREVTRHGKAVWYVRIGKGPRIRIKYDFATPEFMAAYQAIVAGQPFAPSPAGPQVKFAAKTLGWAIEQYRQSANAKGAWGNLSPATRAQREPFLYEAYDKHGHATLMQITRASIEKGMAKRQPNPAKHFFYAMRGLFQWLVAAQLCADDPTAGLKPICSKSDGHPPWPAEWCRKFEAYWPLGTQARVDFAVLYYTGLRVGDAVRFGRPHIRKDGMAIIRTEKTGEFAHIDTTQFPDLLAALAAGPVGELTFIATARGRPMNKSAFSARFRHAARLAGVRGSAHGLRKTRATLLVEAGANDAELNAFMAWRGTAMAQFYTRARDRELLARRAAEKMASANENRTSIPAPADKVRAARRKPQ
jgi:integrase